MLKRLLVLTHEHLSASCVVEIVPQIYAFALRPIPSLETELREPKRLLGTPMGIKRKTCLRFKVIQCAG
jgi:hypothetical protein